VILSSAHDRTISAQSVCKDSQEQEGGSIRTSSRFLVNDVASGRDETFISGRNPVLARIMFLITMILCKAKSLEEA
jgi:hypothetical protein